MKAEGPPQDGRRGTGESSASSGKAEVEGKAGDRTDLSEADHAAGGVDDRQDRLTHSVVGPERGPRLQKVLAERGYGSRRVSEELIADGRVTVNGDTAVLGRRVDLDTDIVEVDGHLVPVRPGLVYYLLNKPTGVVATASDPQGRSTVVSLVPAEPRVYPVGRLDADTEGLLLLTNDGELAHRLTHPSFGVEKEYLALVEGTPSAHALRLLRHGVELDDGPAAPAQVSQPEPGVLRLTIHEGRNRQVRRMGDAIGHPVRRLVRVRIGPITDRSLRPGDWRPLTVAEVKALAEAPKSRPVDS